MMCPDKCPSCDGVLMINYFGSEDQFLERSCKLKVDHKISFISKKDGVVYRLDICISIQDQLTAHFFPYIKAIRFDNKFNYSNPVSNNFLPWFEPDFSDYKKLIEKLKTYIVMS